MKLLNANSKGAYGYLARQKKRIILITAIEFAIVLIIFLTGILLSHTNKNFFTLIAVLGCLPACKSLVSLIMYCRAKGCSETLYRSVSALRLTMPQHFDLYLTGYSHNFQISHLVIRAHCIAGITESTGFDEKAFQSHLTPILKKNGFSDLTIRVYTDAAPYTGRLQELAGLTPSEGEDAQAERILHLLDNISL